MEDNPGATDGGLVFPSESPVWDPDLAGRWLVSKMKVIFVRQCYIDLYAMCRKAWGRGRAGFVSEKDSRDRQIIFFGLCHAQSIDSE